MVLNKYHPYVVYYNSSVLYSWLRSIHDSQESEKISSAKFMRLGFPKHFTIIPSLLT